MKIGIVCYPTYGGSGVIATELAKFLSKNGHTVHLFSYKPPFRLNVQQDGVMFHEVRDINYPLFEYPSYAVSLTAHIIQVAKRYKLDLVHVHYAYPHSISAYLAKNILKNRLKFITTLHGTDATLLAQCPVFHDVIRFAIEKSDRVTTVSRFLRNRTREIFTPAKPIKVIPNFVDTDTFKPAKKNHWQKTIIHISNFRPVKRSLDAVKIFTILHRKQPVKLMLVGYGPDFDKVKDYIKSHNLSRDVVFFDRSNNIARLLQKSDLLLITSQVESFGLAALEAMACGIPVVGTRCGGLEEVVVDGQNGFLCEVGDLKNQAERIGEILNNPELYSKFSQNGRDLAVEKFNADSVIKQYEMLYKSLI